MEISEILTEPVANTRVMVKQYRFRPLYHPLADATSDVWLDSGILGEWLGDAISRIEWVAVDNPKPTEQHDDGVLFEAYLDGELIGELRDGANGHLYYALA